MLFHLLASLFTWICYTCISYACIIVTLVLYVVIACICHMDSLVYILWLFQYSCCMDRCSYYMDYCHIHIPIFLLHDCLIQCIIVFCSWYRYRYNNLVMRVKCHTEYYTSYYHVILLSCTWRGPPLESHVLWIACLLLSCTCPVIPLHITCMNMTCYPVTCYMH